MLNRWAEFTFTETESENASKETFHVFARKVSNVLNYLTATKLQPESMISFSLRLSHWAMRLHTAALGNNKHTHTHTPLLLMQNVRQNGFPTSPSCATNYTLSAGCTESNTTYRNYTLNHEKGSYFQKSCMKTSQSIITLSWRGSLSTRQLMSGASRDFMLHIS